MDRKKARRLLLEGPVKRIPAIYDGFSARIAQQIGFPAIAITGNALSGSVIGLPDVGLMSMAEVVHQAGRIAHTVDIPVLCDADTGYGGVLNVIRTVREFEAAGIAGIHLEDQVIPKRCGFVPGGVPVIDTKEYVKKIHAAVATRTDPSFLIIARTDAMKRSGLPEAARRARIYLEAGADAAMVIGANTVDELRSIHREAGGPFICVIQEFNESIDLTDEELNEAGCTVAIHVGAARGAVVRTLYDVLGTLYREGSTKSVLDKIASFDEYNRAIGLPEWLDLEKKYDR